MNPKTFRNAISKQCGFFQHLPQRKKCYHCGKTEDQHNKAKPYALQVCNAGKMPEDFDSWLKANGDSIPIEDYGGNVKPDRIAANLDQYNERPFLNAHGND